VDTEYKGGPEEHCLAHALVIAIARVDNDPNWKISSNWNHYLLLRSHLLTREPNKFSSVHALGNHKQKHIYVFLSNAAHAHSV